MCQPLIENTNSFIHEHFVDISKSEEFLSLAKNDIINIIERNELNVASEEQVFHAGKKLQFKYVRLKLLLLCLESHVCRAIVIILSGCIYGGISHVSF